MWPWIYAARRPPALAPDKSNRPRHTAALVTATLAARRGGRASRCVGAGCDACRVSDDAPGTSDQPPFAEPVRLVGGVNFTTWPDLKWSRGNSHVAALQSKFGEWHASAP